MSILDFFKKKRSKKLRFLFADDFLNALLVFRALWIQGRYGGGKTSLAIILSAWLLNEGHVNRVTTNIDTVLDNPVKNDLELIYDAALLIDETNVFIGDRQSATHYANFLRKTNWYLLMPSVMPPHVKLCTFAVQRVFNGMVYGIPIWVYKWTLNQRNQKEKGFFAIWQPDAAFGSYNTLAVPINDGGIAEAIDRTIEFEKWAEAKRRKLKLPADFNKKQWIPEFEPIIEARNAIQSAKTEDKERIENAIGYAAKRQSKEQQSETIDTIDDAIETLNTVAEEVTSATRKIRKTRR